jgi:ATP-dependent helicase/nuclease subunit B
MSSGRIRRHFIPWDRPLPPQAAAWLAGAWRGGSALDLGDTLVVVPTRQSGRRLREALAELAAAHAQAVFPPRVLTPEALVAQAAGAEAAPPLDSLLAWAEVCADADLDECRAVFPVDPPVRNFAWALRLARQFAQLQATLAEAGLGLGDVVARAGDDFPETERWRQLGELAERHAAKLAESGRRDAQAARIAAAERPALPAGVRRLVLLAVPDPQPIAVRSIAALAGECAVEVVVFAPESEAAGFDAWGRPAPAVWERRELALPDFEGRVHLCADPAAQAERLAAAAAAYTPPDGAIALGLADPAVAPLLEGELARAGLAAFNPEGRPRRAGALFQLLAALAQLAHEPDWAAVAAAVRCPDILAWLGARRGAAFSAARLLRELDRLRADHLPASLAAALEVGAEKISELAEIAELHRGLTRGTFPENAAAALAQVFSSRRIDPADAADARLADDAAAWTEVLRACAAAQARAPRIAPADWWDLALELFGAQLCAGEKPPGALELQGWLELLWEDAPHLAVAGLNDGLVPEAVAGDAFLPETLRARLGLKHNAARLARDAYLLQACAASRPRLDLLLGKNSAAGDPLRPSRLLLRCADAALPERVARLFREAEPAHPPQPWVRAWRLEVPRQPAPARLAVTALRAWLDCPFRFYLRHVRRMAAVDPAKEEMDARDFGTLAHAALEALAREAPLRTCTDAGVLREFLHAALARRAREKFGAAPALPIVLQIESARQRLARAAELEAAERAAGWRTVAAEKEFFLEVGGLVVRGKIDRIDRHEGTGAVRVLDYKTSDQPVAPAAAHLRAPRRDETPREWMLAAAEEPPRVWGDLQLPLYERALAAEFGDGVTCGYFNLPKAIGESGVAMWDGFSADLKASAWRCALGVGAAIRAGEFWPPRELAAREAERDEFAPLFHHGAAASVAWGAAP